VNPGTGRIDQYDSSSDRVGYGYISPSGRIDLCDKNGNRRGYGTITPSPSNGNGSKR